MDQTLSDLGATRVFRCDGCGAQAFAAATSDDLLLLFCGHHFKRHESALTAAGWTVYDKTNLLTPEPATA